MNGKDIIEIDGFLESLTQKFVISTKDFYCVRMNDKTISFGGQRLFASPGAAKTQLTREIAHTLHQAEYVNGYKHKMHYNTTPIFEAVKQSGFAGTRPADLFNAWCSKTAKEITKILIEDNYVEIIKIND